MLCINHLRLRQQYLKFILRSMSIVSDSFLTKKDLPRPTSLPIFGTKLNFLLTGSGTRLHEYIDRRHKQLGSVFCESLGGNTELVFISDPILIKSLFVSLEGKYPVHILPDPWLLYEKLYGSKRGLFFMNGDEWLTNRRVMNKLLLREDAEKWLEIPIKETIAKFIQKWKAKAEMGNFSPSLESDFYKLSTDVIINVLLGTESLLKVSDHYEELLTLFSESVKKIFQTTTKLYGLPVYWFYRFNLKAWQEFKECVDLSLLLAQKIVVEILNTRNESHGLVRRMCDENMSDEMITRLVTDFVIAAGDTSAYTTLWSLLLISKNSTIKEEIRSRDDIYVKHVLKESMRLYPVAPFLTRLLPKESVLGQYKLDHGVLSH